MPFPQPPFNSPLASLHGLPFGMISGRLRIDLGVDWQRWFTQIHDAFAPSAIDAADRTGQRDSSALFNQAIQDLVNQGRGGRIYVPAGTYRFDNPVVFPPEASKIMLIGDGAATLFIRGGTMPDEQGMFDIRGASDIWFLDLAIDGQITTPAPLLYSNFLTAGNYDPAHLVLTKNSSVWIHEGSKRIRFSRVSWRHSGGYAIMADCRSGLIEDLMVEDCLLENNRPHVFGLTAPDAAIGYGAWTGGIFIKGDGRTAGENRVTRRVTVRNTRFRRNVGNCLWSHLYGLNQLHEAFQYLGNSVEDCGLDGILVGGVTGGAVTDNIFRRIGYVATDDAMQPVPRWLAGVQATALDSSGLVKGVDYNGNSFTSINGGCMDLDGHGESAICGNVCKLPVAGEPEYEEDQIAISGPVNTGSFSYGINTNNSNDTLEGGNHINIVGNRFLNLPEGSIRLFACRNSQVEGNSIVSPADAGFPPIVMGNTGAGANKRSYNNIIRHNSVSYTPVNPSSPCVKEDPFVAPFDAGDKNYVFGNILLNNNGNALEFHKDPGTASVVYGGDIWFP